MKYIFEKQTDVVFFKGLQTVSPINPLMPPLEEIENIIKLRQVEPLIYHMVADSKTCALAVFFIEIRRIHGIFLKTMSLLGYDYFDYNFFYCEEDVHNQFLNYIHSDSGKYATDAIVLDNIVSKTKKHFFSDIENIFYFNSTLASENNFKFIYKKKSLQRHYNVAIRKLDYSIEHKIEKFDSNDIEMLAKLHRERWEFDGIYSAFCNQERVNLYLTHKKNKILTILRDKNNIIAMHYGMLLGDTLLWHTPAVNIEYLEFSPIELLLFELAQFCEKNHFSILDYGLGNETYKKRFSNDYRVVGNQFIPLSYKSHAIRLVMMCVDLKKIKYLFFKYRIVIKNKVRNIFNIINSINYYQFDSNGIQLCAVPENKEISLLIVGVFSDLVTLFRNNNIVPKHVHYNRIKLGDNVFCLMKGSTLLSFGWGTRKPHFFVSEINTMLCNNQKLMLYDFYTPVALRGNGYYTLLLSKICRHYQNESLVIFAEKKNVPSNKAILRAGFKAANFDVIM